MSSSEVYLTTGGEDPFLPQLLQAIERADQIFMAIAFVRFSGLSLIFDALQEAVERGKTLRILTGDYLGLTEPHALRKLLQLLPEAQDHACELKIFEARNVSFHPKAYLFVTMGALESEVQDGFAYVGSSNLSKSALQEGIEWNIRVDLKENAGRFIQLLSAYQDLFESPKTQPLTPAWINAYQERRKQFRSRLPASEYAPEQSVEPQQHQTEALGALHEARLAGAKRGVVIMATGLGKTYLAAFDSLAVTSPESPKILFVAHRREILNQAETTFLQIYPEATTGYYMGDRKDTQVNILFASIDTLGKAEHLQQFSPTAFDYIIVDEFHHAAASSYQLLLRYFQPRFLLGLTATPHRTDGADIFGLCDNNQIYELNLLDGIQRQKLAPFQYHGLQDAHVDYQRVQWRQGKFATEDLAAAVQTEARAAYIFEHWQAKKGQRTLAFCVSKAHADFMAAYFKARGVPCATVHSSSATSRQEGIDGLTQGRFAVLFTVDLFNEGVDIPLIDTVMMLRPTESKILFLQQLGRGLRKTDALPQKQLQVLDFLGNHHSFLNRPQALFGIEPTAQGVKDFVDKYRTRKIPLPPGCALHYDLAVIDWLQQWASQTQGERVQETYNRLKQLLGSRPGLLEVFQAGQRLGKIRKGWGSWFDFVYINGDLSDSEILCLERYRNFFEGIETASLTKSYKMVTLQALIEINGFAQAPSLETVATQSFAVLARREKLRGDLMGVSAIEGIATYSNYADIPETLQKKWCAYWKKNPISALCGVWSQSTVAFEFHSERLHFLPGLSENLQEAFHNLLQELIDYHLFRYTPKEQAPRLEKDAEKPNFLFSKNPLQPVLHQTLMREDIPPLFGEEMNVGVWNNGYIYLKNQGVHVLLVNLQKHGLHATYQYHDVFTSSYHFNWQSQNKMGPTGITGKRLVEHKERNEIVHLFVRKERKIKGKGAPFVYCGQIALDAYHGDKPMNMKFILENEAPADFI